MIYESQVVSQPNKEPFSPSGSEHLHCSVDNYVAAGGLGSVRGMERAVEGEEITVTHFIASARAMLCLIF